MKHLLTSIGGINLYLVLLSGCETSIEDKLHDIPFSIAQFNVSPKIVDFEGQTDEVYDTTLSIELSGQIEKATEGTRTTFSVTNMQDSNMIIEGLVTLDLNSDGIGTFIQEIPYTLSTTTISNILVVVIVTNENGIENYAQSVIRVNGISNVPPEVLYADNPTEYTIPQSGTENVRFVANVTDEDGQNNIDGVFLRLISQTNGETTNSPFQLFDDGQSLGDQVVNDSLYTLTFPVSSENLPDTYNIYYYAIDRAGLVSDTVKTTFTLVE